MSDNSAPLTDTALLAPSLDPNAAPPAMPILESPEGPPIPTYCIGKIGERPRMYFSASDLNDLILNTRPDEVAFSVSKTWTDVVISKDEETGAFGFDYYIPPMAEVRLEKWWAAKAQRQHVIDSGCPTAFGKVDTSSISQQRISLNATDALVALTLGTPWTIEWTMADNTPQTFDSLQMIAVNRALTMFLGQCQSNSARIRAEIEAAETVAALAAVNILDGYPFTG